MDDPRIAQYERERADAIELAHRAMTTSYIGAPPPGLRGDADRMVAALIKAGWTPPNTGKVFLPGEPIPPGTLALTVGGLPYDNDAADAPTTCPFPLVEVVRPERAELEHMIRCAQRKRETSR